MMGGGPRSQGARLVVPRSLIATQLALVMLVAAGSPAAIADEAVAPPGTVVVLSDERTETRWAHAIQAGRIYRDHTRSAPILGQLRFFTEDGFAEVYLALESYTDRLGRDWVKIRVPKRPNGRVGWVLRTALGDFTVNNQLLTIDRKRLRAVLTVSGKAVWKAPVGIGAPGTPTPGGQFYVREKFRSAPSELYGTRGIGTSAYAPTLSDWPGGGVVGIHGTGHPELIPGRPSHGCVRVRNPDIVRLWDQILIGTPIKIL